MVVINQLTHSHSELAVNYLKVTILWILQEIQGILQTGLEVL